MRRRRRESLVELGRCEVDVVAKLRFPKVHRQRHHRPVGVLSHRQIRCRVVDDRSRASLLASRIARRNVVAHLRGRTVGDNAIRLGRHRHTLDVVGMHMHAQ